MQAILGLEELFKLKAGENSHLSAEVLRAIDLDQMLKENGIDIEVLFKKAREETEKKKHRDIYNTEMDLNAAKRKKERKLGWTNVGDIGAVIKTAFGLGEIYKDTDTPYIAVASKHTRPIAVAVGRTQKEALIKALAGDLNSPFGGFWGFNTDLEPDTAEFLNRPGVFIEGVVARHVDEDIADRFAEVNAKRFLIETGDVSQEEIYPLGATYTPTIFGNIIKQSLEPVFDVRKECVVVTGNNGNTNINSLDDSIISDIGFAGNAAIYLASNLVFYVHDGAITGLGDGCGARTVAAAKGRLMLEDSAYAAISADDEHKWQAVLYDTPYTRRDFQEYIKIPVRITAFSDAFYPKLDGFVETIGIDRINPAIGRRQLWIKKQGAESFIPKRNNYNENYNRALIPVVVVQPGGSLGDKVTFPLADKYNIKQVFTMDQETFAKYQEKGPGKGVTGRRFFGHNTMQ